MRYMLMIYGSDEAWNALDQVAIDRISAAHKALQRELAAFGELVDHKELALEGATIVRKEQGKTVSNRGPFTEGRQVLGGYYLVDCTGLDRAVEIASRFVEAEFAPIEIRRLGGDTTWDAGAPTTSH